MDFRRFLFLTCLILYLCQSCTQVQEETSIDFYQSELFKKVQLAEVFPDSKTFVDCIPGQRNEEIIAVYNSEKNKDYFDIKEFVNKHFTLPKSAVSNFVSDTSNTLETHIASVWPVLTRDPDDYNPLSSLIPLPKKYIVPGGRFGEIYYWDSYFTQLGLMVNNQQELAQNMVDNFTFLLDSLGFIPNGNRRYYLGRSQPPFYSLMVKLVTEKDPGAIIDYLPALIKEYEFWMDGEDQLSISQNQFKRVVLLKNGLVLNRHWDEFPAPRPESFKEDLQLAKNSNRSPEQVYRDIRAACESGWDFSSRWLKNGKDLQTIQTTEILPVDLNCLLYHLEIMIAGAYEITGDITSKQMFREKAEKRKRAIQQVFWNEEIQFYEDFNFIAQNFTGVRSLAGAYPLFFEIANEQQAVEIGNRLENEFLKPGGFVTTLSDTGQQWDAPNGWAPLQWITIKGLLNYNKLPLAREAAKRWLEINERVFKSTGKMVEKYNVLDLELSAGGGEYPIQDGFGWTNGVALQLLASPVLFQNAIHEEAVMTDHN